MARMIDAIELRQRMCALCNQDYSDEPCEPSGCVFVRAINETPTLTPPNEPRAGLYGKYTVYKNKDGSLVTDCFILRPAKDPAAVIALRSYAAATDNAELSADIINWVGAEPNESLTIEQLLKMDGQPVWVEDVKHWALIDIEKGGQWDGMPFAVWAENGVKFTYNVESRDLHCYRRPPEGEEDK